MLRASKLLVPVLLVPVVLGIIGLTARFAEGDAALAFGSYVPWGLWVGLYIFLVGLSGGACLIVCLRYGFGITALHRCSRYAAPIALVALGAGLGLTLLDLGHVERVAALFLRTNPTSPIGWMIWTYLLYSLVLVAILIAMALEKNRLLKWLSFLGFMLVVTFGGGEGALYGVVGARAFWHSGLLPIRFLAAALLSGTAAVALATALFRRWPADAEAAEAVRILRSLLAWLLAAMVVIEFAEVSIALYTATPSVMESYRLMLFGPYGAVFWILQLAVGFALPALILVSPLGKRPFGLGLAGLGVLIGCAAAKQNIVLPGLAVPAFRELPAAFVHPRLTVAYFPTSTEWYVAIGVLGAAVLAFVLAIELVPFLKHPDPAGAAAPRVTA